MPLPGTPAGGEIVDEDSPAAEWMPAGSPGHHHHVLVVDDDERLCRTLVRILSADGFSVSCAHDGAGMWRMLRMREADLIILDLWLPGEEDGLSLARRLRTDSNVPLIMLTGRTDSIDKVLGLETGADDYITKPFDSQELTARIRSVLRRSVRRPAADERSSERAGTKLRFAGWTFDPAQRELITEDGDRIALTGYEHDLLQAFVRHRGRVLSRDSICELVANRHWHPDDRSIDVLVAKLRRKLGDGSRDSRLIKTVRGRGYVFAPDVSPDCVSSALRDGPASAGDSEGAAAPASADTAGR